MSTSTKTQHTAWQIEAGPITEVVMSPYMSVGYSISYEGGTFRLLQRVPQGRQGYDESHSRARLIAAAPELLEALEWALTILQSHNPFAGDANYNEFRNICDSAIAKARGAQ
jgi:hypothetical protein